MASPDEASQDRLGIVLDRWRATAIRITSRPVIHLVDAAPGPGR